MKEIKNNVELVVRAPVMRVTGGCVQFTSVILFSFIFISFLERLLPMIKENVLWYVTCEFTANRYEPKVEILLFKAKTYNEAVEYLGTLDIDKKLSEYDDKVIKVFKYIERIYE